MDVSLRLGITRDIVTTRLTNVLSRFQSISFHGRAIVNDTLRSNYRWQLDNGLLDLVLLPTTMTADIKHAEKLWEDDIHLVLPVTHPLVTASMINVNQLVGVSLILNRGNDNSAIDDALLAAGRLAGLTIDVTSQASFLETRLMLVAAGLGITALPALSSALAATPGIVGRPLSPPLKVTTVAMWPVSGPTPAAQRFLTIARSLKETDTEDGL
ncbi:hypothetical protein GCM10007856_04670 [Azospirillum oryzae]|nr:hypothetical protein GCM10007856_04670 [Azospirillum oryzae]